ncbi:MAG TPA: VIT1/CCC1 transporter family protein, partial [Roseiflexaceae bacterium]|nr:VIT1/CCC1 transporter family protein [Roseiflexaceae bacterium]
MSFLLFALGAIVPVVPFLMLSGTVAIFVSVLLSMLGLFGIGAAITLLTGRSIWYSGARQVLVGLAAAAITFGIGRIIGVTIAG